MARPQSYYEVLTEAIADIATNGFDSAERLAYWQLRLKEAAEGSLMSLGEMQNSLRAALTSVYQRLVERGAVTRMHPGVGRFTVDKLRPQLQAELQRRILASADLIVLNRQQSVAKTLQRFSGWASSIPAGGSRNVDKVAEKKTIRKSLVSLPFEERRVLIDQGHKLTAAINETIANDGGAIAFRWHSNWRQTGYNYRKDHKERDQLVYLIRGSWAQLQGLIKPGPAGYSDKITSPAEEPFCRCYGEYLYNLRDLPEDMLTKKGLDEMARVRRMIANA